MAIQQMTPRQAGRVGNRMVSRNCDRSDSRSAAESLLRDLALVLHATRTIRREMQAGKTACSAAS